MMKYIFQLRRGTKEDWIKYEATEGHIKPLAGELVLEYDENNIPRLKIGDGEKEFSQLEYMSVDSFILPKKPYITLKANDWVQCVDDNGDLITNRHHQVVTVSNGIITPNSQVDLQPDPDQLIIFRKKDLAFTAINEDGVVTVYAVGVKPTDDYDIQATVTEVIIDD